MLPDSILMWKITVCLKPHFWNQISNLSYLEQLLSKVFRADSENPEHPERFSRSKFVFWARLSTMGSESRRPSRLRFCNLEQWDRRPCRVDTSITEFDRSRCCRRKGLRRSTNGWSINDRGQQKATTPQDKIQQNTAAKNCPVIENTYYSRAFKRKA